MTEMGTSRFRLGELKNVQRLRPIRVLLVGRDARYLRAIEFLLGGRGYETQRVTNPARVLDKALAFSADIVILDGGASLGDAARHAAALVATTRHVGVVVVAAREAPAGGARLRFVEKWTPFERLVEAVEGSWAELEAAARERTRSGPEHRVGGTA